MTGKKLSFFRNSDEFRDWLQKNHASEPELVVGFHKRNSGRPSITYPEARDQALCFGWIDGVRNALDEVSYTVRFTPRKPRSIWSNVNIGRAQALTKEGLMAPAGMKAFEARTKERTGVYSFERKPQGLDSVHEQKFKANKQAWQFFVAQAPWYRRTSAYWVMSAKKEETREKRFLQLVEDSGKELKIKPLRREPAKSKKPVE